MKKVLAKLAGKTAFFAKEHGAELLSAAGVVSVVSGVVMTTKASLKVHKVMEEYDRVKTKLVMEEYLKIEDDGETVSTYNEEDVKKEVIILQTQTGLQLVKMYAPAVILTTTGIACLLSSNNILKKRLVALSAAYKTLEEGYTAYRRRVVEEYGEEKDLYFKTGLRTEKLEIEEINEKGKPVTKLVDVVNTDNFGGSPYSRIYSRATSSEWMNGSIIANEDRLEHVHKFCNTRLQAQGYMFINSVYEELGFEPTIAGQEVGWLSAGEIEKLRKQGIDYKGDGYIDFLSLYNNHLKSQNRQNREEYAEIPLDFNVDGPILAKLAILKLEQI